MGAPLVASLSQGTLTRTRRLGCACLINPPKVFSVFWKVISPFIDKKTATKIQMINTKTPKGLDELSKRIHMELTDDVPAGPCTAAFDVQVCGTWCGLGVDEDEAQRG